MSSRQLIWTVLALIPLTALHAQERELHVFETKKLESRFFSEGATFGDLDKDGHGDAISGPYWYRGPEFKERREIYPPKPFDVKGYSNNFFAWVRDMDADGWPDIFFVGFPGKDASWFKNPGPQSREHWQRFQVFDIVDNESPTLCDLFGDGRDILVCQKDGFMGWAAPANGKVGEPWPFHRISKPKIGGRFTHGLGVGDIDGDGRKDIMSRHGWWQQPEDLSSDPEWKYHEVPFAGRGGAQMFAYDVDGDGDNDVITSWNAHGYGFYWHEQQRDAKGIRFVPHRVMGDRREQNRYGVVVGNLHALALVDMDGDGLKDVVLGNRYWAHGGRDKADREKASVWWFELVRRRTGEIDYRPHLIHSGSGVGTQVVASDADGDGLADVIVGNKAGTFVHRHRIERVSLAVWQKAQPRQDPRYQGEEVELRHKLIADGIAPKAADGRVLNLDFETGDLSDWVAEGDAFKGTPIQGDRVHARRKDMRSRHQGRWWVGSFEPENSDRSRGTLTSAAFPVTHPYASFLVGGGAGSRTRVEILSGEGKVLHSIRGGNREDMALVFVDLRQQKGKEIHVRLVDDSSGGWGHINFDCFRFHAEKRELPRQARKSAPAAEQGGGFSGEDAAERMSVPEGFRVDLMASEPQVHQPIAMAIDEKGRVWVAEAYSYPIRRKPEEAKDRIVVFEDRDHDGRFDKSTVFLDRLNLVSGLEVGHGGVWIGAAPELLFVPDADGDLVPDGKAQVLLDGFGWQDTHETLNAFNWGPDGWLYGCHGVFTHSKVGKPGTPDAQRTRMNAAVWRYHPKRHDFELFIEGASNQWGVDWNDHGEAFITACVIPHLYHLSQGGRYQRQAGRHFNPYVFDDIKTCADHLHYVGATPHSGNGVSGDVGGGHAHCGALIYLGDRFPEAYRDKLLFSNIHGNRLNMDVLERRASGYVGRHGKDFLLANDRWFRGINFRVGPGGDLFLIDWYDKQACHRSRPEIWDRTNGRIYRVSYGEPHPVAVDLAQATSQELVDYHLHQNDWYVRQARKLLHFRDAGPEVRDALVAMAKDHPGTTRRLRALWTLGTLSELDPKLALELLSDGDEWIRAWTVRLLVDDRELEPELVARFAKMARSEDSALVRRYLASALQRLPIGHRWAIAEGLVTHARDQIDPNIPLLLWYGIEPLVPADPQRALTLAESSRIPLVSRYVWRRMASGRKPRLEPLVRSILDHEEEAERRSMVHEMGVALAKKRRVEMPASWPELAPQLLGSEDSGLRERGMRLALVFGDRGVVPHLMRIVKDAKAPADRRRAALRDLLSQGFEARASFLRSLLDDPALRLSAIRGLASEEDAETTKVLLALHPKAKVAERTAIESTLASRLASSRALLEAVGRGELPKTLLDSATLRRQLVGHKDAQVLALLEKHWGKVKAVGKSQAKALAAWKKKLTPRVLKRANLAHGRQNFAVTCMKCHTLFGVGGNVGPDITGSNRGDLDYILANILDPSAEVAKDYRTTSLLIEGGRLVDGIVVDENDQTLSLRTDAETLVIAKSSIDRNDKGELERWFSESSMMPTGQLDGMSDAWVRDLIAYLGSKEQVAMTATEKTLPYFFNGQDLSFWDGDPKLWSVENGEIVGRAPKGLKHNAFLSSHLDLGNFRLTLDVKLVGNEGNSGIQFRSIRTAHGMKGHQADVGKGWWGRLYEEEGRGLLSKTVHDDLVKKGEWNRYEIVAVGGRIMTAINGLVCVDLQDDAGARRGGIGLQIHSGGPTEVRFRNLVLELNPTAELKTVSR